jgi:hypothetical protein
VDIQYIQFLWHHLFLFLFCFVFVVLGFAFRVSHLLCSTIPLEELHQPSTPTPFPNICFWHLYWKSDSYSWVGLFLGLLLYFTGLHVCLVPVPCHFCYFGLIALFFLFRTVLAIWGLLCFYTNFRIFFSISGKNDIEILMGIALNL